VADEAAVAVDKTAGAGVTTPAEGTAPYGGVKVEFVVDGAGKLGATFTVLSKEEEVEEEEKPSLMESLRRMSSSIGEAIGGAWDAVSGRKSKAEPAEEDAEEKEISAAEAREVANDLVTSAIETALEAAQEVDAQKEGEQPGAADPAKIAFSFKVNSSGKLLADIAVLETETAAAPADDSAQMKKEESFMDGLMKSFSSFWDGITSGKPAESAPAPS